MIMIIILNQSMADQSMAENAESRITVHVHGHVRGVNGFMLFSVI
jgi:hypothetical protein